MPIHLPILRWQEGQAFRVELSIRPSRLHSQRGWRGTWLMRDVKPVARGCRTRVLLWSLAAALSCFSVAGAEETNRLQVATNALPSSETNIIAVAETNPAPRSVSAQATSAPGDTKDRMGFSSFKIISERNIFNPNRSAGSARNPGAAPAKAPKIESFALLGTLSSEKGRYAFFDGTSAVYKQAVAPAGTIAGYKVSEIEPNQVKLEAQGKKVMLGVGMQMRRQDEGEWRIVSASESAASRIAPSASGGSSNSPSAGDDEVLKKLMQQREQELTK